MKAIALQRKTFFISISLWCILTTDAQGHLKIIGKGSDLFRLNTYFLLFFGDLLLPKFMCKSFDEFFTENDEILLILGIRRPLASV